MSLNIAIACLIALFLTAIIYLYMFSSEQAAFMRYWAIAWIAYCISVLFLIFYINTGLIGFLIGRKIMDMANLLFILFGTYSIIRVKLPSYWYRFSCYMILLSGICMLYHLELLSCYLPISIYQLIVIGFACYNILRKMQIRLDVRFISSLVFFSWGTYKALISIYEVFNGSSYDYYVYELMFSSILNICILILYITNKSFEETLSDNIFQTIVEQSQDTIFYYQFRPYESFKYVTPSIRELTGYESGDFYHDPHLFLKLAPNESLETVSEIFNASSDYKDVNVVRMIHKNNDEYWAEFHRKPVYNDSGRLIAMECTVHNVTDLHSARMEQIKTTESRNMLLSYISHELRTPITSIAGYLTAIQDGVMSTPTERQEALDIITSKTITLKALVDDLDQLTKLETNQFTFNFILTNAGELTTELITNHLADAEAHNFAIEIHDDISHLLEYWVIIDMIRIDQIFSNLISNAYKYATGDPRMTWTFEIDHAEQNLIISVEDHGDGIPAKDLNHIFDKFYRADLSRSARRKISGRGLGLTLCREMIRAHNGDIYVESEYGNGSKFTFFIPLYKEES